MATSVQVPLNEYLSTSYRPDREYVDGMLVERNVGQSEHARIQALLTALFISMEEEWGTHTFTEQRFRTRDTRFRIPDILLTSARPQPPVITEAPILCVEILSPEDSMAEMKKKGVEFFERGARAVWIIDPAQRCGYWSLGAQDEWHKAVRMEGPMPTMYVDLEPIFRKADRSLMR